MPDLADFDGAGLTLPCLRAFALGQSLSLTMLSPAATAAFEPWAINRRCFEIALETLVIGDPR